MVFVHQDQPVLPTLKKEESKMSDAEKLSAELKAKLGPLDA